MTPFR